MSTNRHDWYTSEGYDGGLHHCRKCDRSHQGPRPKAHDCPVSDAEHSAAAWLGQAGLYRTRLDAVLNGEQSLTPVSAEDLFKHASRYLYVTRTLRMGLKAPNSRVTKTPDETDAATDAHLQLHMESWHA
ncbi:hypothetical protein KSS94_08705 [Pseudomonas fakonensis]|uniref:Uncharacterized protein n=1 Tax=Pseudomonas fakonensis TaxID=2842355 RepID=A0ABX8N9Z4_9PSED|nr:hypothetical protein [Pseudomonas fakonensis]QXH53179.1 hypothetical protein KSS94_08705 [Pseudomonas fakonensis]